MVANFITVLFNCACFNTKEGTFESFSAIESGQTSLTSDILYLYGISSRLKKMISKFILLSIATACLASSIRGVSPDHQGLYKPDSNGNWHCLLDPSIVLLFNQINDDYCDCPDGLDEPGTNACPYTPESPKYFCANDGFKPGYLESYKLNDGVCDYDICCDGSDEYISGICPNLCKEAQAQYESFISAKKELNNKGLAAKRSLQLRAAELKKESEFHIAELSRQVEELEKALTKSESSKGSDNGNEQSKTAHLIVSEEKLQSRFESYKLLISELQNSLAHLEGILNKMAGNYNPNFNDAAVKNAIHLFQDYFSNKPVAKEPTFEFDDIAIKTDEKGYQTLNSQEHSTQTPTFSNMLHYYYEKMLVKFPKYEKIESKQTIEEQLEPSREEVERRNFLESKKRELINEEQKNKKDYGNGDILRAVEGKWYEKAIGDYNYKIGFLNAIYQDNTLVGRYAGIDGDSMQFVGGDRCWNGPQRSATVVMICNQDYDLISVFEPQKCHYQFKLMSPLVCQEFSEERTGAGFKFVRN